MVPQEVGHRKPEIIVKKYTRVCTSINDTQGVVRGGEGKGLQG